jgi:hypothetical protein
MEGRTVFIAMMRLSARPDQILTPTKMTALPSILTQTRRQSLHLRMYNRMAIPLCSVPAPPRLPSMGARMVTITPHCLPHRWTGLKWWRMKRLMAPPNFLSSILLTSMQLFSIQRRHAPLCHAELPSRSARLSIVAPPNQWLPFRLRHLDRLSNHLNSPPHPRSRPLTLNQSLNPHQRLTAVGNQRGRHIKND